MSVKLYYTMFSPPARAVIHTLKALSIPHKLIDVNLLKGETVSEDFLKRNPQHTVPTIEEEDGFILWESHAINSYLVDKYGKEDDLYPKELKTRAIINQRLHFNNGVLFPSFRNTAVQIIRKKNIPKLTDQMKSPIKNSYDFVEKFLNGRQYIAGDNVTIADFSILTTLNTLDVLLPTNDSKYPLITDYMKRGEKNIPGFKEVEAIGKEKIREIFKSSNFEL